MCGRNVTALVLQRHASTGILLAWCNLILRSSVVGSLTQMVRLLSLRFGLWRIGFIVPPRPTANCFGQNQPCMSVATCLYLVVFRFRTGEEVLLELSFVVPGHRP